MRTGICTLQQALTAEAESTVKQAINLARGRGHAQVTPLHVASAMLLSPTGFMRRACLYCHSHPLQCKALELCFNVALNRLPSSSPSPLLGPHYSKPSLSNALVAAFKRAQAHQRRGSVENQQQPILALKIEVEQLIISILDDPSVSRVMREAGFSSTQVKSRVEQTVSLEFSSQPSKEITNPLVFPRSPSPFGQFGVSIRNEDVTSVLEELSSKRKRNTVIVGECLATVEDIIRCLIDKFEKGNVPKELRYLPFISLPLSSVRNHSKEEVEQKLTELRCIVKSSIGRGAIIYLGDLKWVSEFWSDYSEKRSHYSHLEQIVMEIKRIGSGYGENGRFLVMGSATFQTYMRCKKGHPSLETIWELHPLALPLGSLNLTLNLHNDRKEFLEKVGKTEFISPSSSTVSSLPLWLQKYREESRGNTEKGIVKDSREKPLKISALSPSSSNAISSLECNLNLHLWAANLGPKISPKEHQFWVSQNSYFDGEMDEKIAISVRNDSKPDLLSNPNSSPNSASSSEVVLDTEYLQDDHLMKLNSENLRVLCDALEKRVPWQKHTVLELSTVILQRREKKEACWLFFLGNDSKGKEKVARELAKLVFGSQTNFISTGISSFSSSSGESKNKRTRDEIGSSFLQRFGEAMNENPSRVFLVEDFDEIDCFSQNGIKKAIQNGSLSLPDFESFPLRNAIIILSCESTTFSCSERRQKASPIGGTDSNGGQLEEKKILSISLDLNISIAGGDGDLTLEDEILEAVDKKIVFSKSELD